MLKFLALLSDLGMAILSGLGVAPRLMYDDLGGWGGGGDFYTTRMTKKKKKRSELKISTLLYT